jgi:hypothetical protein
MPAARTGQSSAEVMPLATQSSNAAVIDFSPLPAQAPQNGYNFSLKLSCSIAAGTYDESFSLSVGMTPTDARGLVEASLKSAGWTVAEVGTTSLSITGYTAPMGNDLSPITKISLGAGNLAAGQVPKIGATGKVNNGNAPDKAAAPNISISPPTPWGLSFDPTDETSSMEDNATVQVFLNGTEIDTAVTDGMTADQVDQAVESSLEQAGVDAVLSGGTINFTSIDNQSVTSVQADFASNSNSSGQPVDWLATDISLPAPGSLGM